MARLVAGACVARARAAIVFDAEQETPVIVDTVERVCPAIREWLSDVREGLPLVPTAAVGRHGRSYRLPGHHRSFCLALAETDLDPDSDVLVFKGTEPLLPDFPAYLDWMMAAPFRASDLPVGLHFPLMLRMPPGAMPLDECERERDVAVAVHERHLDAYDCLAQSPVPLLAFRLAEPDVASYVDLIRERLPGPAFQRVEARARAGLGVLVYYYPTSPIRVADLELLPGSTAGMDLPNVTETVELWVRQLARLLGLGYLPYVPWNHGWGACVDLGNACIDGGFADLLTLVPIDEVPDDRVLRLSVLASLEMLAQTVVALLGRADPSFAGPGDASLAPTTANLIRRDLLSALRTQHDAGRHVDLRLLTCLDPTSVAELIDLGRRPRVAPARSPIYSATGR